MLVVVVGGVGVGVGVGVVVVVVAGGVVVVVSSLCPQPLGLETSELGMGAGRCGSQRAYYTIRCMMCNTIF